MKERDGLVGEGHRGRMFTKPQQGPQEKFAKKYIFSKL